jgi:predicted nucleic acid-binding protein
LRTARRHGLYLADTDVISELRKHERANRGVRAFFADAARSAAQIYVSVVTIGELRRGVELLRHRGDADQAALIERWLLAFMREYGGHVLQFDADTAQVWGRISVPNPENPLDKQIAATALIHGLTLVTRNVRHFADLGVEVVNPFTLAVQ